MLLSFRGDFDNKVDAKGRVSVPAPFRRILEAEDPEWTKGLNPSVVIVYGDERRKHLECFTINAIQEVDAKIRRMPRGSKKRAALSKLYFQKAITTSVDETGRLVLSPRLREKAQISGTALFIGNGDTFEIWNPEIHDDQTDLALGEEEGFDPALDPSVYLDGDDGDGW